MTTFHPTLLGKLSQSRSIYLAGKPYPHLVIDNFFSEDIARQLYQNFPSSGEMDKHYHGVNEKKSEGSNFSKWHPAFTQVREGLRSEELAKNLEQMTGLSQLSVPEDEMGAGIHQGFDGSFLDIHVDFSIHHRLKLHRRLNLLVYLNPDWKPEYNGGIELWDAQMSRCEKTVEPLFNRAVLFECSDTSYHGYSLPLNLPEGVSRKSIFCYFYTPLEEGVSYHDTIFKPKPDDSLGKRLLTPVKESFKNQVKKTLYTLGIKF